MDLEIIILNEMSERKRQIPYDISYMQSLKYDRNLFMKQEQTHKHRKQSTKRERGWGRDKLGVWCQQIQTTIYKTDINRHAIYKITRSYCIAQGAIFSIL